MSPENQLTSEELRQTKVLTAREIGFLYDSSAKAIKDPDDSLLKGYIVEFGQFIKFIIAQNTENRQVSLGVFYPSQAAATCAHALREFLNGTLGDPHSLAAISDRLSYGLRAGAAMPLQSPIQGSHTLIGGGQIDKQEERDRSSSMTIDANFGLSRLSREHMQIVRGLVLQKLNIPT